MAGRESFHPVPDPLTDPEIGEFICNVVVKITGGAGTEYANDFLELGVTVHKTENVNRVSLSTSRPGEFPDTFVTDVQAKLPEILAALIFGAMNDTGCPGDLKTFDSGLTP